MPIDRVVVDASPLICLSNSGHADLLPALFKDIVIPDAVNNEIMAKGKMDSTAIILANLAWKRIVKVEISPNVASWDLGSGESAVLSFALRNPDCWAIIDDLEARRCAISLGCRYIGTVGIIMLAKKRGIIKSVRGSMEKLKGAGLWLSEFFINDVCRKAGE